MIGSIIAAVVGAAATIVSGVMSASATADASAQAQQLAKEEQKRADEAARRGLIAGRHQMAMDKEKSLMNRDQYRIARTQQVQNDKTVDREKLGQMLVSKASNNPQMRRALWDTWGAKKYK